MSANFIIRLLAVLLAIAQPIIIVLTYGLDVHSISSMWGTPLQPLFIVTNAITSFFLFEHKKWIPSSVCLLLLTAFSFNMFPTLHNWLAYGFFIFSLLALYEKGRHRIFSLVYLLSLIFWIKKGFFWMEVWAVYVICAYHIRNLWILYQYEKSRKII